MRICASGELFVFLLNDLEVNQQSQNDTADGVNINDGAGDLQNQTDNKADDGNPTQQGADQPAHQCADNSDHDVDDQSIDQLALLSSSKCAGEEFLEHIHNLFLLAM